MPPLCSIYGCGSVFTRGGSISFFRFPKDERLREEWVRLCKRPERINPETARICSVHFAPDAFERNLKYELLRRPVPTSQIRFRKGAVPTLHLPGCVEHLENYSTPPPPPPPPRSNGRGSDLPVSNASDTRRQFEALLHDPYGTQLVLIKEEPMDDHGEALKLRQESAPIMPLMTPVQDAVATWEETREGQTREEVKEEDKSEEEEEEEERSVEEVKGRTDLLAKEEVVVKEEPIETEELRISSPVQDLLSVSAAVVKDTRHHTSTSTTTPIPQPPPPPPLLQTPGNGDTYVVVKQSKLNELLHRVRCRVCCKGVAVSIEDEGLDTTLRMWCGCDASPLYVP